jgi:hypothetical protein
MRLGQLARKLEIRPAEIVEFLALNHIQIEEGANTRLEDDLVNMILRQFNPDFLTEVAGEPIEKNEPEDSEPVVWAETVLQETEAKSETPDVEAVMPKEAMEVIKAPKVELSGLKVLGKIELPEKKKKEEQPELQGEVSVTNPSEMKPQQRKQYNERKENRGEQRTRKNPIALQREREALEEQKKREEKAELEKERRTRNYHKRVKMSPPTKSVRLVDEPVMQMSAKELEEEPKTWLGRLVKWFTTA